MKKVYVFPQCSEELEKILNKSGFSVTKELEDDTDFVISVGGDGTFLRACRAINFRSIPIIGINTGHLGYFTELMPNELDKLEDILGNSNYSVQEYRVIKSFVETDTEKFNIVPALNDVQIRHWGSTMIHLKIYVGQHYVENFNGDGILVSSSAGSTAYNYALGGSIVDPRISLLQMTPIAPANNTSYRSFMSSIILPPEQELVVETENDNDALILADGADVHAKNVRKVTFTLSENAIKIIRLPGYDFWGKVKSKFL